MQPVKNRSMLCVLTTASQAYPLPGPAGYGIVFQNIGGGQVAYVAFGNNNQVVTQVPVAQGNLVVEAAAANMGGFPILANAAVPTTLVAPPGSTHFAAIGSAALSLIVSQVTGP